jgi:hypothetical protein
MVKSIALSAAVTLVVLFIVGKVPPLRAAVGI